MLKCLKSSTNYNQTNRYFGRAIDLKNNAEDRVPPEQCNALFSALLVHDDIHLDASLPDQIYLEYSDEQLARCYQISWQLWKDGIDRKGLSKILRNLYLGRPFTADNQLFLKHIRAKFKHLRCSYTTFDRHHTSPRGFHRLTAIMGYLQDAIKHGREGAGRWWAVVLSITLTRLLWEIMTMPVNRFQPAANVSFRSHVSEQIGSIRFSLGKTEMTSKEFHELRKIISGQVALYDNLKILYPSRYHASISEYLSTINGLMGSMHDKLVIRKFDGSKSYYSDAIKMPVDIRNRLAAYIERFAIPEPLSPSRQF
jgi:hypothetical protein